MQTEIPGRVPPITFSAVTTYRPSGESTDVEIST